MSLGPFTTYAPPGVYTRTLLDPSLVAAGNGLQLPVFIGVSQETKRQDGLELRRGSAADLDIKVINEDVSDQFDGTNRSFTVANFPIVNGSGAGVVTNDMAAVIVTITHADESLIAGTNAPVQRVDGAAGEVTLGIIPFADDIIRVTYYFRRTDTLITSENLSDQVDGTNTTFKTFHNPIVVGDDGGKPTTDPNDIKSIKITRGTTTSNGVATAVDGDAGLITIFYNNSGTLEALQSGDILKVSYYTNTYRDTFDYLPDAGITNVVQVGFSPNTSDFDEFTDFIIEDHRINWGAGYSIAIGTATTDELAFGSEQVNVTLADNRVFNRPVSSGPTDGDNNVFILETVPVDGTGVGRITDDPALIQVRVGTGSTAVEKVLDAIQSSPVLVSRVYGSTRTIELVSPPPADSVVLVSYYDSLLLDASYTITVTQAGPGMDPVLNPGTTSHGEYTLTCDQLGDCAYMALTSNGAGPEAEFANGFGTNFLPTVQPVTQSTLVQGDFQTVAGSAITEQVTLTMQAVQSGYTESLHYLVTSDEVTGSGADTDDDINGNPKNMGFVGQTYKDPTTGMRFTLLSTGVPTTGTTSPSTSYSATDEVVFDVTLSEDSPMITTPESHLAILGARMNVANTASINTDDTAVVRMFDPSGSEPNIGDYYYITYDFEKEELPCARVYTKMKDVVNEFGDLLPANRLTLASYLAFLNGALAVGICQIPRESVTGDAAVQDYIDALIKMETPQEDPNFGIVTPDVLVPITPWSEFRKTIFDALKKHCELQSSIRFRQERRAIFGFETGTKPGVASTVAKNYQSDRMMAVYPDGGVIPLMNAVGQTTEYLVDGSFIAAAITGLDVSPAFDEAEPLTRKQVVGFRRLARRMDSVTLNQTASSGVTILKDEDPVMFILQALSTNMSSVLTREWSITKIKDLVQKVTRKNLSQFIGRKFLKSILQDIETTMANTFKALIRREIIAAYTGIRAEVDKQDPTICNLEAYYSPIFPLNWIKVTFNLRSEV